MFFLKEKSYFPVVLANAIESTLNHLPQAPGTVETHEALKALGKNLRSLWPLLAKGRGQVRVDDRITGKEFEHYSLAPDFAATYAAYYMPANCLKLTAVLLELEFLGESLLTDEFNWLDFGCGPGTGAIGLAWFHSQFPKRGRYLGLDQSSAFLREASRYQSAVSGGIRSTRAETIEESALGKNPFSGSLTFQWQEVPGSQKGSLFKALKREIPTVVSFLNSVAEWEPDVKLRSQSLVKVLRTLAAATEGDGRTRYLVLIEPGSRASSRELIAVRDAIIKARMGEVLTPCLDSRACGAKANADDWCHEEIALAFPEWHDRLGEIADLRKSALLFSYLVVRVPGANAIPWSHSNGVRMVSQRLQRKGFNECYFCSPKGEKLRARQNRREELSVAGKESLARGKIHTAIQIGNAWNIEHLGEELAMPLRSEFQEKLEILFPSQK